MVIKYQETTFDMNLRKSVAVADWICGANLDRDGLIVGKSEPESCEWKFRIFKVEDCSDFVFDLKKTKIRAIDGVEGLMKFMERETKDGIPSCFVNKILNYAWDNMKYKEIA